MVSLHIKNNLKTKIQSQQVVGNDVVQLSAIIVMKLKFHVTALITKLYSILLLVILNPFFVLYKLCNAVDRSTLSMPKFYQYNTNKNK